MFAVAGAEIAQDGAELGEIGPRLVGGAQVRLRQRSPSSAATPERLRSTSRVRGMEVMDRLGRRSCSKCSRSIADLDGLSPSAISTVTLPSPTTGDLYWLILIALRQIRIEIILAVDTPTCC